MRQLVRHWANVAVECGADGIILPGSQLDAVGDLNTVKLNPAVRIPGHDSRSKQVQVSSPSDAIMSGSDILVVGSPIYAVEEPVAALKKYLWEVHRAESDLGRPTA